ncbi:uncharacterized protein [Diadema antillarum]|uniref:uncharacterized protein n=1 Tax=Diadema antillarum TaxID=105358 RepID=UPI003A85BCF0
MAAAEDITDEMGNRRINESEEFWEELDRNLQLEFSPDRCLPTDPLNGSEYAAGIAIPERSLLEQLEQFGNQVQLNEQEIADLISSLRTNEVQLPTESNNLLRNTSDQCNEQVNPSVGGQFHLNVLELPCSSGGTYQQAPVPFQSPARPQQPSGSAASAASVRVQNQAPPRPTGVAQVVRDNSTRSEPSASSDGLPLRDDFKVKVMFRKKQVIEREKERDCTLYYQSLDHDSDLVTPVTTTKVPIMTSHTDFLNEGSKEKRLTLKILENCLEGVRIFSDCSGNIFVRRLCKAHVYWSDVETTKQESSKLKHDKVIKVFDFGEFYTYFRSLYPGDRQHELIIPSIWLSFAQKHGGAAGPVNTCLVWVRIDPLKAREMVEGVNPEVRQTSLGESLNSANIQDGMSM